MAERERRAAAACERDEGTVVEGQHGRQNRGRGAGDATAAPSKENIILLGRLCLLYCRPIYNPRSAPPACVMQLH